MEHDITKDEEGLLRVNSNLLPLLRRLGIKGGGGGFGMPPIVMPVINVETLDEVLATLQLTSTINGTMTNINDNISIVVPAGETWKVEHIFYVSNLAAASRRDILTVLLSGTFQVGVSDFMLESNDTQMSVLRASFNNPFYLVAGDIIRAQRITSAVAAATAQMAAIYRLL